jgi:FtsP/CotA-like multicopper oxidase with cupredoxin domain
MTDPRQGQDELAARLDALMHRNLSRRNVLRAAGLGTLGAAAALVAGGSPFRGLRPRSATAAEDFQLIKLAATDGFIYVPGEVPGPAGVPYLPDPLAPGGDGSAAPNMWAFGFRNVTDLTASQTQQQRGKFQASAPQLSIDETKDVHLNLRNLGLSVRPDLTDSHTIHWHGFRQAIPLFDGVPELSIAVPIGRDFTYFYRPSTTGPGTYMYHCHFEDVEHVSMGMTGIIFVRAAQNYGDSGIAVARLAGGTAANAPMGYVYNDGVPAATAHSTAYDREFGMFLSEAWAQEHFEGAHIQEHDWSDYDADIWLLNGRSYPDTLEGPGGGTDASGDLIAPAGRPELQYQPISSLVRANSGDRILLRFVSLGFQQHFMTIDGLQMRIVGKDATLLRGRDGTWQDYLTNTVEIAPGESVDAIIEAPAVSSETTFLLYNRNLSYLHNPGMPGLGGQMTEIRISPAGTLPDQTEPNT